VLYKHKVPDGQAYVFYIDVRAGGKGYEEFIQRAKEEDNVIYLRGKVSKIFKEDRKIIVWGVDTLKIFKEDGKIIVWGVDTLTGKEVKIASDLVVLATPVLPNKGVAEKLKITCDEHGFFTEAHPKLRPVESSAAGIYLAGCCQEPKDIPETVAQASGAAGKVVNLLSGKRA